MEDTKQILSRNVLEIIDRESLEKKLNSGKKLIVKLGVDPTSSDLHIGHAVSLWKLKEFQDAGHKAIFLIGDYTARVGDPSGRSKSRKVLSEEDIQKNTESWLEQAGKILDLDSCEVRYNSEWYSKMSFTDILDLFGKVSLANVTEREDFKKRLSQGSEVGFVEAIYPVMQGYDSVALKADVELGGYDQRLNLLMGRDLQKKMDQAPQDILTMPLLMGTDGNKMSKSEGNYIGLNDAPEQMYGKVMSISDGLIEQYLDLATNYSDDEIEIMKSALKNGENPKITKEKIAVRIVEMYHGEVEAQKAVEHFERVVKNKEVPDEIDEKKIESKNIIDILVEVDFASSKSDARRLVEQKGVRVDGEVADIDFEFKNDAVLQVGKLKHVQIKVD
jgi:tyrosyl-tRNA synthetase